jgi:hypothetical protein
MYRWAISSAEEIFHENASQTGRHRGAHSGARVGAYAYTAHSQDGFGMHRMGPGMMGMAQDAATQSQLQVIHTLLVNHDRVTRTVTNLPDGIHTVTESNDPALAAQIKTNVTDMGRRVSAGDDPGLPIESEALHAIFHDKDKIRTSYETTSNGVAVVQTSDDAKTVAAQQTHAAEVTDLVQGGMAALQTAMMKNHDGMMGGGMMHGPMMMHGMMHRGAI